MVLSALCLHAGSAEVVGGGPRPQRAHERPGLRGIAQLPLRLHPEGARCGACWPVSGVGNLSTHFSLHVPEDTFLCREIKFYSHTQITGQSDYDKRTSDREINLSSALEDLTEEYR